VARYDLAIIGAGPAGAACAYHAARRGLRVLLLEARRLPRPKLCSGVLTYWSERDAAAIIGVDGLERVTTGRFARTTLGNGQLLHHRTLRLVDRARFDLALVEAASQAGADVVDGVRVTVRPGDAPLVVDATGSAALMGRRLQRRERLHFGVEVAVPGEADACRLNFALPGGYWWSFPHDGFTAIGGATWRRDLWADLPDSALGRWGALGVVRPRGHMLRRAWGPVAAPGLLLVGEAAGALDQALGEGIRFALWTGRLAGEAAALGPGRAPAAYAAAFRRQVAPLLAMRDVAAAMRDRLPCEALLRGPVGPVTMGHYLGAA